MKALFIGGTGTISTAISKELVKQGHELYLINRGNRNSELSEKIHFITCDINNESEVAALIKDMNFDVDDEIRIFNNIFQESKWLLFFFSF